MKSKRIKWLDFARGLAMFFVVVGHVLINLERLPRYNNNNFLYALSFVMFIFVMPGFFAISGFLYKPTNTIHKYKVLIYKKICGILIPYILFSIIDVGMHRIFLMIDPSSIRSYSWSTLLSRMITYPISYMWFLYALFFIFIITGIMDLLHFNIYFKLIFSMILFCISQTNIITIPAMSEIFQYIICFELGYSIKLINLYHKDLINKYLLDKKVFSLCSFIWIILIYINVKITGIKYITNNMTYADVVTKLFSIFILFMVCANFNENSIFNYFDKYGKVTLVIYLVHLPIFQILLKIALKFNIHNVYILLIILICATWYTSLMICHFNKKYSWVNYIFYPTKFFNKYIIARLQL